MNFLLILGNLYFTQWGSGFWQWLTNKISMIIGMVFLLNVKTSWKYTLIAIRRYRYLQNNLIINSSRGSIVLKYVLEHPFVICDIQECECKYFLEQAFSDTSECTRSNQSECKNQKFLEQLQQVPDWRIHQVLKYKNFLEQHVICRHCKNSTHI